jgi:hypothetical protein
MLAGSPPAPVPLPAKADAPTAPYTSSFALASFGPGSYELRITVHDRRSGQNQLRRVTFLVE